jgi:hypothetical protein
MIGLPSMRRHLNRDRRHEDLAQFILLRPILPSRKVDNETKDRYLHQVVQSIAVLAPERQTEYSLYEASSKSILRLHPLLEHIIRTHTMAMWEADCAKDAVLLRALKTQHHSEDPRVRA